MNDPKDAIAQAEAVAFRARGAEIEELVERAERSEDRTLQSLARAYRFLGSNPFG